MQDLDGLGYRGATVVMTGAASGMGEAARPRAPGTSAPKLYLVDVKPSKVPPNGSSRPTFPSPIRYAPPWRA